MLIGGILGAGNHNGFAPDSDVAVVGAFGSDNVIPFLVGMQGGLVAAGFKPFDHFLINDMMSLEGELFTTSGNHAIWVSDVINRSGVEPDVLRYYLAKVSSEGGRTDFSVGDFIKTSGENSDMWSRIGQAAENILQVRVVSRPPAVSHQQAGESPAKAESVPGSPQGGAHSGPSRDH